MYARNRPTRRTAKWNGIGKGDSCDIGSYEGFSSGEVAGDVSCDAVMNTVDGCLSCIIDVALRSAVYQCPVAGDTMHLPRL